MINPELILFVLLLYSIKSKFDLSRYGFCVKRAQQYKISFSLPTTNQSCPMPLLDRKVSVQPEIEEDEEEKCLNHVRHETNAEEFV